MADIYINADSGDDGTGDGSSGSPYETLAKAITEASAGDTVIAQSSTAAYDFVSQTIGLELTIRGESVSSMVVFDGADSNPSWTINDAVTIKFIEFKDTDHTSTFFGLFRLSADNSSVTMENCIVHDCIVRDISNYNDGIINFGGDNTSATVLSSLFYNITKATGSDRAGIFVTASASNATCTVTNCSFHFNESGTTSITAIAGINGSPQDITFDMKNNIFSNDSSVDIPNFIHELGGGSASTTFNNNCTNGFSGVPSGSNNLDADPLFIDADNANFSLRPSSPCIQTGTLI